jgi:hypothetical protein
VNGHQEFSKSKEIPGDHMAYFLLIRAGNSSYNKQEIKIRDSVYVEKAKSLS